MIELVHARTLPKSLEVYALDPPAWTRLEPQSVTGDPTPGLEAGIHDPLWLLLRQWQFGEFDGEDAGTPLAVAIEGQSRRATAWQPGDLKTELPARPITSEPLDPLVEREPPVAGTGLRERAQAGSVLVRMLRDAGFDAGPALLDSCAFSGSMPAVFRVMARSAPDATLAAAMLEGGSPAWLTGAPQAAIDAASAWLTWYRANVGPDPTASADAWIAERLEYRFSVRLGAGQDQQVMVAPLHEGGAIDWYSFDHAPGKQLAVEGNDSESPPEPVEANVMATPVRFPGMPADRLWQFEDGTLNFGKVEVQRHDLARLCFVEFALIHGNDWFVVPLDVQAGCHTRVTRLQYTNTFGDTFVVPPADDRSRAGRFRLFEISHSGSDETLDGLFVPPAARGTVEGRALEQVLLLRDETANMAWAIEGLVQDDTGEPFFRRKDEGLVPDDTDPQEPAELRYLLSSQVPRNWIPLVPVPTDQRGGFVLRKGTMTERDESLGQLLHPMPFNLQEEEVPREGVIARRVPALIRTAEGRYVRWMTRRVTVGRGEGSSGLAFDSALKRRRETQP